MVKVNQRISYMLIVGVQSFVEGALKAVVLLIMVLQPFQKVQHIRILKGAVNPILEVFSVGFLVVDNEIVWGIVHQRHEFASTVDDARAGSPGEQRCKKSRNFYILWF